MNGLFDTIALTSLFLSAGKCDDNGERVGTDYADRSTPNNNDRIYFDSWEKRSQTLRGRNLISDISVDKLFSVRLPCPGFPSDAISKSKPLAN